MSNCMDKQLRAVSRKFFKYIFIITQGMTSPSPPTHAAKSHHVER